MRATRVYAEAPLHTRDGGAGAAVRGRRGGRHLPARPALVGDAARRARRIPLRQPAPRTGTGAAAAGDPQIDDYLHTFMANRGVLLTPFHNMALMCPATTDQDVDLHTELFGAAVQELLGVSGTSF